MSQTYLAGQFVYHNKTRNNKSASACLAPKSAERLEDKGVLLPLSARLKLTRGARRWSLDVNKSASACLAPKSAGGLEGKGGGSDQLHSDSDVPPFFIAMLNKGMPILLSNRSC